MAEGPKRTGKAKTTFYLEQARLAAEQAQRSADPRTREGLLRIAQCWKDLACSAED